MSCNARPNNNETLCLGSSFARSLNINEGDEVFVSSVKDVPFLTKINVAPRTTSDREILVGCNKMDVYLLNSLDCFVNENNDFFKGITNGKGAIHTA